MSTATATNGAMTAPAPAAAKAAADLLDQVLLNTDLSKIDDRGRASYYRQVCESLDLNPLTKPFDYLLLKGERGQDKLVLYATKACTDQLRKNREISVEIVDRKIGDGLYVVTARARTADGRVDESTGAVPIEREGGKWKEANNGKRYFEGDGTFAPIRGEALANAIMKAETKAKRRVTLSICGLGMIDDSEVDSIPGARRVDADAPAPVAEHPTARPAAGDDGPAGAITDDQVLAGLASIGATWSNVGFRAYVDQVIGRSLGRGEAVAGLTQPERAKLMEAIEVTLEDKRRRAAPAEQPAATPTGAPTPDQLWTDLCGLARRAAELGGLDVNKLLDEIWEAAGMGDGALEDVGPTAWEAAFKLMRERVAVATPRHARPAAAPG